MKRICGMPECDNKVSGRGLCNKHYQMWYKGYNIPTFGSRHSTMQEKIKIIRPSEFGLGWLAGLLEGEAHFSFDRTQVFVLGMTDKDIIVKAKASIEYILQEDKPIHLITTNWRENEKPVYTIRLYGARARAIMKLIVPYLGYRRRSQIWKALNRYAPTKLRISLGQLRDANAHN